MIRPTPEERAYLLRCATMYDEVARLWDGPPNYPTSTGICFTVARLSETWPEQYNWIGRVPPPVVQVRRSRPPHASMPSHPFWWAPGRRRAWRAAHCRKLAALCRRYAGSAEG